MLVIIAKVRSSYETGKGVTDGLARLDQPRAEQVEFTP